MERREAELWLEYGNREAPMTLAEIYKSKFKPWMMSGLAPKTTESYECQWNNHIRSEFGNVMLTNIKPRVIQD